MDANSVIVLIIDDYPVAYSDRPGNLINELENLSNLEKEDLCHRFEENDEAFQTMPSIQIFSKNIDGPAYIELIPAIKAIRYKKKPHPEVKEIRRV